MKPELIQRYSAPVPRYTSYPTANHFTQSISPVDYGGWLSQLDAGSSVSLYLHIPYCEKLCWYCGCSTKPVRRYEKVSAYVTLLEQELRTVAAGITPDHEVKSLQWGGGSPDILQPGDIVRLATSLRAAFRFAADLEFGVEIDPRLLTHAKAVALVDVGVNRISIGVQDFEPSVQVAIGREQSYEETAACVDVLRRQGVNSMNIDLVYGLPQQTVVSVGRTMQQVLTLQPDRIAVFGYAHLPSRLKHQRLIDERTLPGAYERFAQMQHIEQVLTDSGYVKIGIDHFAKAGDALARCSIARNFQGYTTDRANALIGLGASAISRLPQGYAQNSVAADAYADRLAEEGLATVRGRVLTTADRVRACVIERLMCDFRFSSQELAQRYGSAADEVIDLARSVVAEDTDDFVEATSDGFQLSRLGRPFVRNICARFDAYLAETTAERRHAPAV